MQWDSLQAKNGQLTLKLNNLFIYSRYRPFEDAKRWAYEMIDTEKETFVLIGLGLGYHAVALAEAVPTKTVYVYYFDEEELALAKNTIAAYTNIKCISTFDHIIFDEQVQLLIPDVWIKAIGEEHPLFAYLQDIKINQRSYKKYAHLMAINFDENTKTNPFLSYPTYNYKNVCIVASGPSLNDTIFLLKKNRQNVAIICVGSALKMLLKEEIIPDIVVISDPKPSIKTQLEHTNYTGDLYYLSTANYETVQIVRESSYILFQQGYPAAEELAKEKSFPLIEAGGSVSTVALSLAELLGFEGIFLFGQDFTFSGEKTHAENSTSGKIIRDGMYTQTVRTNAGELANTSVNLLTYLRWFQQKINRMHIPVYTTALHGAAIKGIPYISEKQFISIIEEEKSKNL